IADEGQEGRVVDLVTKPLFSNDALPVFSMAGSTCAGKDLCTLFRIAHTLGKSVGRKRSRSRINDTPARHNPLGVSDHVNLQFAILTVPDDPVTNALDLMHQHLNLHCR